MTSVVLRCPNCGTVQRGTGECDACHEGEVRYFCINHSPGRWLEAPACDLCGARFGEVAPEPRNAPAPAQSPAAYSPAPSAPKVDSSRSPWAASDAEPGAFSTGDYAGRDLALERLRELLDSGGDVRASGVAEPPDYGTDRRRRPGLGCGKIVLTLILAFLFLAIVGPLLLGTVFVRLFM